MATYNINLNLSTAAAQAQLSALQTLAGKPITAKVNFSQPLGRMTGDVAMFDKSMAAATARVSAFGAVSGAIYLVSKAMSEAAKSMMLVDKELTELNTFLGQSQGQLKAFGDSLFSIAKNTATSFGAVAEAAKEFARQGLSMEDTLKRTSDALILSRISGLGAAESVTALTTAINSFNKSGLDSSEILNKLIQVDSQFAVSSNDLAQALSRVGSSAQDSGVSIDQLIASVTAAQQTTGRGGAVIGNALKTIFTRMKRPEVIDQLREIGVAVKDQNGFFLDGITILKNYTDATKNLSQTEKARTAELLGGIYQINVLNSLINDLSKSNGVYARSLQASNTATDQAFDKNEALNQSLSATIEITKANLQQKGAAIATPLLTPLVKTGAAIVNKTLNIFDKKESDEEGEKGGRSFGESLLKGLGAAIAGPGIVIVGALAFAIGKKLLTFGVDAVRSLLGVTSASQNILNLQTLITSTLNNQPRIMQQVLSGQMSQTTAAQALLTIMQQQSAQLQMNATLSSTLANTLAKGGFVVNPATGLKRRAMGHIPKADQDAERAGALSGGYSPGAVVKTPSSIGGIMNTSEKVKYIPGFSQPFINPPENSKAGRMHQENAIKQTGVNPYFSEGFIPNFVKASSNASAYSNNLIVKAKTDYGEKNKYKDDYFYAHLERVNMSESIESYKSKADRIAKRIYGSAAQRDAQERPAPFMRDELDRFIKQNKNTVSRSSLMRVISSFKNTKKGIIPQATILNTKNQIQGVLGESETLKISGGTATKKNAKFDIVELDGSLSEVRTRGIVRKPDILLKAILQNLRVNKYSNDERDVVDLGTYKVYMPKNAKFYSSGFVPNFAYVDKVKKLEEKSGNGTSIFDTKPFPHVRNSSQPTFESAINDHGGLQNALSDSVSMQKGAGLIKSKGFVPNFSKISDWWEQKMKDEKIAQMGAYNKRHGSMTGWTDPESPSMMSGMIRSSVVGGATMLAGGWANPDNVGMIANAQRGVPLAMAGYDVASGFARGKTKWGKAANVGVAIAQNAPAVISGFAGASQTEANVRADQFQKVKDSTADKFNKLTQNAGQLAQSIEDLNNAYSDPSVSPEALIKLGKKQAQLMSSMDKSNPETSMKLAMARTSAEKQTILAASVESATKDKVVNDASIKFLELEDEKRKPKAIKSLFSDWSSQADMSKLDVKNLTSENLGESLQRAGIGDVNKVLGGTEGKLITPFINFLKMNEEVRQKEEVTKNQLINVRRAPSAIRLENERNQKLRTASRSYREGFLDDMVGYSSNFGPEAAISARADVAVAKRTSNEVGRFDTMLTSKVEKTPALNGFVGRGPSLQLGSEITKLIAQAKDPEQKNILEGILSENQASLKELSLIRATEDIRKGLDLKLLSLQQRLVFGGGMAASLSFEGKMASDQTTGKGALQNSLGRRFGSQNTADAGYVNFAKGVKEKYAGLDFGPGAFGKATEVGANLRARDLRTSLLRDASRADQMGDSQLAGAMRGKANDWQGLYDVGKTQTEAHLGIGGTPNDVEKEIALFQSTNSQEAKGKRSDDRLLAQAENAVKPIADALITALATSTEALMSTFEKSLKESFARGLKVDNATIIVGKLNPNSEKKEEGSFWDGVTSAFSDMVSGVSDWFTGGPQASEADQKAAAGMGKSSGFIPNFKNPLKDAIRRESEFVPFNSIRVNQSNKLKQSNNPFGLAVTNTIDEPRGLASIGLANDGYIPNFAAFGQKTGSKQSKVGKLGARDIFNPATGRYDYAGAKKQSQKKSGSSSGSETRSQPVGKTGSQSGYKMSKANKALTGLSVVYNTYQIASILNNKNLTDHEKGKQVTLQVASNVIETGLTFAGESAWRKAFNSTGGSGDAKTTGGKTTGGKATGGKGPPRDARGRFTKTSGGKGPPRDARGRFTKTSGGKASAGGKVGSLARLGAIASVINTLRSEYDIYKDYKNGLITAEEARSEASKTAAWGVAFAALPFIPVVGPVIAAGLAVYSTAATAYAAGNAIEEYFNIGERLGSWRSSEAGEDEKTGNFRTREKEKRLADRKADPGYAEDIRERKAWITQREQRRAEEAKAKEPRKPLTEKEKMNVVIQNRRGQRRDDDISHYGMSDEEVMTFTMYTALMNDKMAAENLKTQKNLTGPSAREQLEMALGTRPYPTSNSEKGLSYREVQRGLNKKYSADWGAVDVGDDPRWKTRQSITTSEFGFPDLGDLGRLSPENRSLAFRAMTGIISGETGGKWTPSIPTYVSPVSPSEKAKQDALEIKNKKDLMLREYMRDPSLASVDPTLIPAIRGQQSKVLDDRLQRLTAFLEKDGSLTRKTYPGKSDSQILLNYLDMPDSQREKVDAHLIKQESLARSAKETADQSLLRATTPENPALTRTFAALGESNQVKLRSVAGNPLTATTAQGLGLTSEGVAAAGMLSEEKESINKNQTESMVDLEKLLNNYSNGFIPARGENITNYKGGMLPDFRSVTSLVHTTRGNQAFKTLSRAEDGVRIYDALQQYRNSNKTGEEAFSQVASAAAGLGISMTRGAVGSVIKHGNKLLNSSIDYGFGKTSGGDFAKDAAWTGSNLAADLLLPPQARLMKKTAELGWDAGSFIGDKSGFHEGASDKLAPMFYKAMNVFGDESGENINKLEDKMAAREYTKERKSLKSMYDAGVLKDPYFSTDSFDRSAIIKSPETQLDPWNSTISAVKKTRSYAEGFTPVFAQEKRAVLSSPSYAGYRDAVPMRSKVYKNAVINSAEIEVPVSEVYSRMFGPAGANMKPKNPSETHAILNPAQQQSLGFNAGFIPNFSTEQFTAAITEAMRNGIASFAGGMIPNVSHSNVVNINDERSYQGNSDSMMDGVLDILQSKFPKEMGKIGPRIAKR